ncbi:hypothetical protein N8J89_12885 [Crossiella sp. CA-258035]|uniref:RRQRL motif-containing zinc-binding protein n=1 Tax=Crossiella sp. CA-258035 TaxID=2981138 RepID=UPI0024BC70B5|nr:RRQRL motif-containing zinc-binding protein [Crossiella sp. CA-258035]WHT21916.1 hypothetical protein N8J89_12885 [Crossiella sp. CA-258035]
MRRYRVAADCHDPHAQRHPIPTYAWGRAPDHLVTRRQLRAAGWSPGQHAVAQMLRPRKRRPTEPLRAWLYDIEAAVPKRVPTAAQLAALDKALRARRTCPACERDVGYCLASSWPCLGDCLDCAAVAGRLQLAA